MSAGRLAWGAGILLALGATVGVWDEPLAAELQRWHGSAFAKFMERSLFEGHWPGGSDLGVLASLAAFVLYFCSHRMVALRRWRRELGYWACSSFLLGTVAVQCLKWVWARPRPYAVFSGEKPFRAWWEPGGFLISDGRYAGSFPSGHTGTVLTLAALSWILFSHGKKGSAVAWLSLVTLLAMVMGGARTMAAKHWPSDSLLLIPIAYLFLHLFFHRVFRVPERSAESYSEPGLWEFLLSLGLGGCAALATASVVLLRASGGLDGWFGAGCGALSGALLLAFWSRWYFLETRRRSCADEES